MKYMITLACTLLLTTQAFAHSFECVVKYNYQLALQVKFEMDANKSKKFGVLEDYEFTLKDTGKIFELELYNALEPSRTYAVGDLNKSQDLGLIIWNREKIMEVSCKKLL